MYYSRVDIILFGTGLFKSAFSTYYLVELDLFFCVLVFRVSVSRKKWRLAEGRFYRVCTAVFWLKGFWLTEIRLVKYPHSVHGAYRSICSSQQKQLLISYLTMRMSHDFNLNLFPRGFYEIILYRAFYKVKNLIHDFGSKSQIIFKCCNK